jgi:hypothetical protein
MSATIDTGEFSGPNGTRVYVSNARPLVDLSSYDAVMSAITRDQLLGDPVTYGVAVAQEVNGDCPLLAEARHIRFRTLIPNDTNWRHMRGVSIERKSKAGGKF